jgi:ABC-2 type transport system ATP-binding protein
MEASAISGATARVLADVGLGEVAGVKLRDFSKGMQQRFALACALLGDPELLFLDEPTSALDPLGRAEVRRLLLDVRERGTTVFLNSHLLGEVEQVCDEVAVIDHGRLVASGTLGELLAGPCEVDVAFAVPFDAALAARLAADGGASVLETGPTRIAFGLPSEDAIPALVEQLVASGARLTGVVRRRRTLESLFLEVTSEGPANGASHG